MLEPERNGNSLKNNSSDKQSHLTNEKDSTIIVTSNVKLSNQQEIHSGPANSLFNASSKPNTNFILDSNDCDENCKPSSVQNKGTCAAKCYRLSTGPDPSSGAIPKLNSNLQVSDRGTSCRPKEHKRTLDKSWSELEDPFEYTEGQERRASISDPFFFKDCVKDLDKSFDLHADEYYTGKDYVSNLASKLRDGDIRQNDNSVSTFGNQKRNIYDSRRFPRQNDVSKNAFFGLGKLAPTRSPIHQPGKFTRESRVGNITDAREYYSAKKDFGNNIDMVSSGCDAQDETSRPNPRLKVNEVNDESFRLQELERRTKLFFEKIRMNRDAASQFLDVSPTLMTSDILSSPSPSSDSLNLYDFNEVQSEFDAQFKSKMLDFVNSTNSMLRQTRYLNISLTPEPLVMLPENWPSFSSSEPHNSTKLVPPETSKLFCETNSEFPTSQTTTVISSPVPSTETTDSFEQNIVPETRTPIKRVPLLSDTVPHFKYSVESPETDVNLPSSINSRKTVPNQKSEDTKLLQSYVTIQESLVAFNDSVNPTSSKVDKPVTTVAESFTNAQETENRSLLECPTEFVAPNIEDSNLLKPNPEPRKRRASIVTCDSVLADEHPSPDPVKIIVLGDDGVGKTALIVRLVTGRFIGDYDPTLSAVYSYNLPLEGYDEQLQLMDTGGQAYDESHVRWSDAVLLVFSVTSRKSFSVVGDILHKLSSEPAQDQHLEPEINDGSKFERAKRSEEKKRPSQLPEKCKPLADQSVVKEMESLSETVKEQIWRTEDNGQLETSSDKIDADKLKDLFSKSNDGGDNFPVINVSEHHEIREQMEDFCRKFSTEETSVKQQANDDNLRKFSREETSTPVEQTKTINVLFNNNELNCQYNESSVDTQSINELSETEMKGKVGDEKHTSMTQCREAVQVDLTRRITMQSDTDNKLDNPADLYSKNSSLIEHSGDENVKFSNKDALLPIITQTVLEADTHPPKFNPPNDFRKLILILGNKNDLSHRREVKEHEGETLASSHRCRYAETAASAPWEEVALPFMELYNQVMAKRMQKRIEVNCHREQ